MVKKRTEKRIRLKKRRYAIALIFVLLIFAAGTLFGSYLSKERIDYLENEVYVHRLNFQSLQLQSLFLSSLISQNRTANCEALNYFLEQNLESVAEAQQKVEKYMRESDKTVFYNYKREYIQAQINYWLMYQEVKRICEPNQAAILYFYSNEACNNCGAQGTILDYLKNKFGQSILIFSLDADLIDEPMIGILKETYNVEELPSLVIEDELHEGLMNKQELSKEICKYLVHDFCEE